MSCFSSPRAVSLILLSAANETVAGMTATTLGYARVSTTGQDLKTQIRRVAGRRLIGAGVHRHPVGCNRHPPARAGGMLDYACEDDIVVVTAIDRLGRSVVEGDLPHYCRTRTRRILLRACRGGVMATSLNSSRLGRDVAPSLHVSRRIRGLPARQADQAWVSCVALAATEPVELAAAFGIGGAPLPTGICRPQWSLGRSGIDLCFGVQKRNSVLA